MRDGYEQIPLRKPIGGSLRPFDNGDPVIRVGVPIEPEAFQITGAVQPIEVEMVEPDRGIVGGESVVLGDQAKRGAPDRLRHPEAGSDSLRQRGFPGTKITMKEKHVTGSQLTGQISPKPVQLGGSAYRKLGMRSAGTVDEHGRTAGRVRRVG